MTRRGGRRLLGESVIDHIQRLVAVDANGCWLWLGTVRPNGYGVLMAGAVLQYAHRYTYETFVGPIPSDLEIDHLCRVRNCVNPQHLEAVTHQVNMRRAREVRVANTTHCKRGHEFTPDNTYRPPKRPNVRHCLACQRAREQKHYAARRAS